MLAWHSGSDPLRYYGRGRRGRAGWRWRAARRPRQLSVDGVAGSKSSASRGNAAGLVRPRRSDQERSFVGCSRSLAHDRRRRSTTGRRTAERWLRANRTSEGPHRRYRSSVTPQRTLAAHPGLSRGAIRGPRSPQVGCGTPGLGRDRHPGVSPGSAKRAPLSAGQRRRIPPASVIPRGSRAGTASRAMRGK